LLAKFGSVMQEHISHVLKGKLVNHFRRKYILSEVIAEIIHCKIVTCTRSAKDLSTIADGTSDFLFVGQLFVTIRYVDVTNESNRIEICQTFLEFTSIHDSSGKELTDVIPKFVEKYKLELKHRRGQAYGNATYMKGIKSGVQGEFRSKSIGIFIPCWCQNMNLVLCGAAKYSAKSATFFDVFKRL
jgi:hypothetical protein